MAVSAVPALIDALVAAATPLLSGVAKVSDGFDVGCNVDNFLMIGVDDPDTDGAANSASSQQRWANANHTARDEEGDITCAAVAWNGDCDPKAARDAAYGIAETLATALRANPSLDLPTLLWTGYGTSTTLTQDETDDGARALVVFTVHFRARI